MAVGGGVGGRVEAGTACRVRLTRSWLGRVRVGSVDVSVSVTVPGVFVHLFRSNPSTCSGVFVHPEEGDEVVLA